jgi:SAM-dependent methyltransferase
MRIAPTGAATPDGEANADLAEQIGTSLTSTLRRIETDGAWRALAWTVGALEQLRMVSTPDAWRTAVTTARAHPTHAVLEEDPYIKRARLKPCGHAGDAETIDYVYRRRAPGPEVTGRGRDIHGVTTSLPIASAMRVRLGVVAAAISATLAATPGAVVLSVACGHMRELHDLPAQALKGATIIGIDQDVETTHRLTTLHADAGVQAHRLGIGNLIKGEGQLPPADLIYASGLFDHLDEHVTMALLRALIPRLRPGGRLLIANLTPANTERAFMEAVMDWWMIYRTDDDLWHLGQAARGGRADIDLEVETAAGGRVAFLTLSRMVS